MNTERGQVVWILGAGFSKSLGGLLLPELLSERSRAETLAKFTTLSDHASRVYPLFAKHQRGNPGNRGDRGTGLPVYWEHAEEFLDFVDTAANGNHARATVLAKELNGASLQAVRESCIRIVAAECELTSLVDISSQKTTPESWQPYIRWVSDLNHTHSVITFNYDVLVEKLGERGGPGSPARNSVFGIDGCVSERERAQIYKLHGSIDWINSTVNPEFFVHNPDPRQQIVSSDLPCIATPGPSKKLHCTTTLKNVWTRALDTLTRAAVVVFVGYRFPPSDAESRHRLLGALRQNQSQTGLRVHTVLGPNTGERDTIRLKELLRSTLSETMVESTQIRETPGRGNFQVIVNPLYAEDFFEVFHPNMIFGHSMS